MPSTASLVDLDRAAFGTLILSVPHVCSFPPVNQSSDLQIDRQELLPCQDLKRRTLVLQDSQRQYYLSSCIQENPERSFLELKMAP
ncbi:hypothetical protein N431DRAFT_430038 [Stipitochalara longipes BDJ]|nr:hypothetical protein N431DRAFT_430038 [Stipitochalara longipes BDJ]